jgi:hypothetical protein
MYEPAGTPPATSVFADAVDFLAAFYLAAEMG